MNNLPVQYPGILSDGRLFTDYSPSAVVNEDIRKRYHLTTNQEYKDFLVKNTNMFMKQNMNHSMSENRTALFPITKNGTPHLFTDVDDTSKPYGYESSLPKNMFLSRQQLDDKKRRPLQSTYE